MTLPCFVQSRRSSERSVAFLTFLHAVQELSPDCIVKLTCQTATCLPVCRGKAARSDCTCCESDALCVAACSVLS